MEPATPLLDLPAATAIRWIAMERLRAVRSAADLVAAGADGEATRRLQADLRRVRSVLGTFAPLLEEAVTGQDVDRLQALAEAVDAVLGAEPFTERPGLVAHRALDLEARRLRRAAGGFAGLARRLERRLATYAVDVRREVREPRSTAAVVGRALGVAAEEARAHLASWRTGEEGARGRPAREAVERLRDLLEPFAAEVERGGELLARLGVVESVLSRVHDVERTEEPAPEWLRSGEVAAGPVEVPAGHPAPEHRDPGEGALLGEIAALASQLAGAGPDVEIERKFLLRSLPVLPDEAEAMEVDQGWFGTRPPERVRRMRDSRGARWFRAIKHGGGIRRLELEEQITEELFAVLWPLTEGRRVSKRRYRIDGGELRWEIDQFTDRDLVLAEVELPTPDHPVTIPAWLAAELVREVTYEPAFLNVNLAR